LLIRTRKNCLSKFLSIANIKRMQTSADAIRACIQATGAQQRQIALASGIAGAAWTAWPDPIISVWAYVWERDGKRRWLRR
jgi:hypothetical protein